MAHADAVDDLAELQFSPVTPEEIAEIDDRVYLLGVSAEQVKRT
jgi:hypothetical protein